MVEQPISLLAWADWGGRLLGAGSFDLGVEGARHDTLGRIGQADVNLAGHAAVSGFTEHQSQGVTRQ